MTDQHIETLPAVPEELIDVATGERLPATVDNALRVIVAAREMKYRIGNVIRDAESFLAHLSLVQGTKTFHVESGTVELKGGTSTEYDALDLINELRAVGCPEERIEAAVATEVSYKVNRAVLRQLASANPDYAAAAERAARRVETPLRASVKPATGRRTA